MNLQDLISVGQHRQYTCNLVSTPLVKRGLSTIRIIASAVSPKYPKLVLLDKLVVFLPPINNLDLYKELFGYFLINIDSTYL